MTCNSLLKDSEVPLAVIGLRHVGYDNITVKHQRIKPHRLMYGINPGKFPKAFEKLWSVLISHIQHRVVRHCVIPHLHDLDLGHHALLKLHEFSAVGLVQNLVRIGSIDIITGCFREREIAGCRKIIAPLEIIDLIGVTRSHFLCVIGRARVHYDDLIAEIRY